jgi:hypothetical protein
MVQKQRRVVSAVTSRQSFAKERTKKIAATKFSALVRIVIVGFIVIVFFGSIFAVFGVIAYSLKNDGKLSLGQQFTSFVKSTPLSFLVKEDNTKIEKKMVVGLHEVPVYPGSDFIFSSYITSKSDGTFEIKTGSAKTTDLDSLFRFLSSGQSVYRLPLNVTWQQVQEYYEQELTALGWKKELSVSISDLEKMPGEYYTKDESGLHIYDVSYDVWYEKVTKVQAQQGLREKVVAYKAKQELVEAASGTDLPSDLFWKLKYSRDWSLETQKHPTLNGFSLFFSHDKSKERVIFSVIRKYTGNIADVDYKYLESVGVEHITSWLTTQPIAITLKGFTKKQLTVAGLKAQEFADTKHNAYFLFLVNKKNSCVYVIQYAGKENPEFYEYIKANLKN